MNNRTLAIVILTSLAFFWGSSFILMKFGLIVFDSLQIASIRMALAGTVFLPFVFKHRKSILKKDLKYFAIVGFIGSGIPAFLFPLAQTHIDSGIAGALNALTPLFTFIIGVLFLKVAFKKYQMFSVLVGLAGALVLILFKSNGQMDSDYRYGLLILLATICYGVSVNTVKYKLSEYRPLMVAAVPLSMIAVVSWVVVMLYGLPNAEAITVSQSQVVVSTSSVVVLSLVGTSLSLILFNRLIKISSAVFASSVTYLIPVVAMIWGVVGGEAVGLIQVMGLMLIFFAIYLMKRNIKDEGGLQKD